MPPPGLTRRPLTESNLLLQLTALLLAVAGGTVAGSALVRILTTHLGHDQAWCLYLAELSLRGVRLYGPHLVEVNPPLIVWFSAIPVAIAHILHITLQRAYYACFLATVLLTGVWSASLLYRGQRRLTVELSTFLLLLAYFSAFSFPSDDIGQREHIVTYLLLPYLVAASLRLRQLPPARLESALIGLLTAAAVCLKPQHTLEILFVEALVLLRLRRVAAWLSATWIVCALGAFVYTVLVRALYPAYFTGVVPILRATYWGFNQPLQAVLHPVHKPLWLLVLALALYIPFRRRLRDEPLLAVLIAAALGGLLAFVQQGKGWSYQYICFKLFTYFLITLLVAGLFEATLQAVSGVLPTTTAQPRWLRPPVLASAASLALLAGAAWSARHIPTYQPNEAKRTLAAIYAAYPPSTPVSFLSTDPWEFPAIVDQNLTWGSRYMHLWMLPAIIRSQDPEDPTQAQPRLKLSPNQIGELSNLLRHTAAEDLAYWKPRVVVIDPCGQFFLCRPLAREPYGTLLGWFTADPRFRTEWAHYTYSETRNNLLVYTRND